MKKEKKKGREYGGGQQAIRPPKAFTDIDLYRRDGHNFLPVAPYANTAALKPLSTSLISGDVVVW